MYLRVRVMFGLCWNKGKAVVEGKGKVEGKGVV